MPDTGDDELAWYHLRICKGMRTNLFFDEYEADPVLAQTIDDICLSCPVRAICLREGIENQEYGVWGGVFLNNGKMDPAKNSHKTDDIWQIIREGISG